MKVKCPDCSASYATAKGLTSHRRAAHGYVSETPGAIRQRELKAAQSPELTTEERRSSWDKNNGSFPCPHCDFIAKWTGGLTLHVNAKHNGKRQPRETAIAKTQASEAIASPTTNGQYREEAHVDRSAIPESAIAFAAGRVEELLSRIANELDLPPKSLTRGVVRFVHTKTLRQ